MPRNTSLPIITGREKGVKMRGFKTLSSWTEKKEKKMEKQSYAKITKAFKKKKSAPKKKVVGIMKHNQVF